MASLYRTCLVVRDGEKGLVVDIIDPHNPNLRAAADKLAGLADYAAQHGAHYGRIESVILDGNNIRRLNLQDAAIREQAKTVKTTSDVLHLFAHAAVSLPTG